MVFLHCGMVQPFGVVKMPVQNCFFKPSPHTVSGHVILYPWKPMALCRNLGFVLQIVLTPEDELLSCVICDGLFFQLFLFLSKLNKEMSVDT